MTVSLPTAQGWMPIETAPKDGTRVDLWYPTGRKIDCFWAPSPLDCWAWHEEDPEDCEGPPLTVVRPNQEPTHWMLSPAAPVSA